MTVSDSTSLVRTLELNEEAGSLFVEQAVERAKLSYVCDPQRRSLAHWWGQHARDQIGWSSFLRRSARGQWPEQRERFWSDVAGRVLAERAGELAQEHLAELRQLKGVRDRLLASLDDLKPKTFEGAVAALLRLDERLDHKRGQLWEKLEPHVAQQQTHPGATLFTTDEYRAMAHAVLQLRMKSQREAGAGAGVAGAFAKEQGQGS